MTLKNKTILITGSDGFTGKVLLSLLKDKGEKVVGCGLRKKKDKSYYQCNLADEKSVIRSKTTVVKRDVSGIYHQQNTPCDQHDTTLKRFD